ncbi:ATP-dependent endonuclease [Streptomyces collinus]|uniref:ATP-dependent nuclease n=1 Tax=Streptomyces collinus TaxID=42684 RepID=UPI00368B1BC2
MYIDTARECFDVLAQIARTPALDELRAQVAKSSPHTWADQAMSYIMGREYELITHQELERFEPRPGEPRGWFYYELSYGGMVYGPEGMSLGELATCVILQALRRAATGSIVLLDEPENFLSPRARQHLLNVIVDWAIQRSLSVVIASHSPEIVNHLPPGSLRTVRRRIGGQGVVVAAGGIPAQASRVLGLKQRPDALLLVEDEFAKQLLQRLLAFCLPDLHQQIAVEQVKGKDNVALVVRLLGVSRPGGMRFLGVLDGDVREAPTWQVHDWLDFLPGDGDPEATVMEAITDNVKVSAEYLGLDRDHLEQALAETEALDPHDQPATLVEHTGVQQSELISFTARWLQASDNRYSGHMLQLLSKVRKLLIQE